MSIYRGQGTLIHKDGTRIIIEGTDFTEEYPHLYEIWGNNPLQLLKRFRKSSILWWIPEKKGGY